MKLDLLIIFFHFVYITHGTTCPKKGGSLKTHRFCIDIGPNGLLEVKYVSCPEGEPCDEPCGTSGTRGNVPILCSEDRKYPAERCDEYYECVQVGLTWLNQLKSCPYGEAFDSVRNECSSKVECDGTTGTSESDWSSFIPPRNGINTNNTKGKASNSGTRSTNLKGTTFTGSETLMETSTHMATETAITTIPFTNTVGDDTKISSKSTNQPDSTASTDLMRETTNTITSTVSSTSTTSIDLTEKHSTIKEYSSNETVTRSITSTSVTPTKLSEISQLFKSTTVQREVRSTTSQANLSITPSTISANSTTATTKNPLLSSPSVNTTNLIPLIQIISITSGTNNIIPLVPYIVAILEFYYIVL